MESDLQNLCQSGFPGLHLLHGDMLERNKFFEGKTTAAERTSPWPSRLSRANVASAEHTSQPNARLSRAHVAWAITS